MSTPTPAIPAAAGPKSIDFAKPFTFAFEDPEWLTKVGITLAVFFASFLTIGCLVGLAGVALLYGYQRRIALRAMQGQPGLPDWDSWEDDLREGAKLMVVRLVWGLPGALMLALCYVVFVMGAIAGQDSGGAPGWALAISGVFGCLGAPLTLLGAIGGEIGVVRCIEKGELAAGFRPAEMLRFARANLVNLLLLAVVMILSGMIAQIAGVIACGIGILFAPGWVFLPAGQAIGQVLQADRAHRATSSSAVFT